ncbi:MAG: hypothetical protein ACP5LX_06300 [Nitrososphaeria archaeon]
MGLLPPYRNFSSLQHTIFAGIHCPESHAEESAMPQRRPVLRSSKISDNVALPVERE